MLRAEMCTAPKRLVRRLAAQPHIGTWLVSVYSGVYMYEHPARREEYMRELRAAVSGYLLSSGARRRNVLYMYEPQLLATLRRDERAYDNYFAYAVEKLLMARAAALVDTRGCTHGAVPRRFHAGLSTEAKATRAEARARAAATAAAKMRWWWLLRGVAVVAGACVGVGAVVVLSLAEAEACAI